MANRITNGILEILNSGSSIFALISLAACVFITIHIPSIGAVAFCSLIPVLNLALTIAEHRETMADKMVPVATVETPKQ